METLTPYIAYIIALSIAAVIPGPGIAALVGQALGGSPRSAVFFLGGLALGDLTFLTLAVAGLAALAQSFAQIFIVIKILGGCYLIYLAYKMWTSQALATKVKTRGLPRGISAFSAGYTVTMGNPKTIIFYLAILPSVLSIENVTLTSWLVLVILTCLVLFATLLPYIYLATKARGFLQKPSAIHRMERFAASIIGAAGLLVIGEATREILKRGRV